MADVAAPAPVDLAPAPMTTTPPPAGTVSLATEAAPSEADRFVTGHPTLALLLISVVGLFLELLLIRWISTEIRIFAYLQNTVLVVCFLGLGMGCWDWRKPFALRDILLPLGILVALLAVPTTRSVLGDISYLLAGFGDLLIWSGPEHGGLTPLLGVSIGVVLTFLLMRLLWSIFLPVGRLLGRLMSEHPNTITAYSVNVFGSLVGIWLFVLASALYLPPVAWFGLFAIGSLAFLGTGGKSKRTDMIMLVAILGLAALAGYEPGFQETRWTPYQKLAVTTNDHRAGRSQSAFVRRLVGDRDSFGDLRGSIFVSVNNSGYQAMVDLDPGRVAADPKKYPPEMRGYSQYDLPTRLHPNPKSMLIVGAGSGNDAAGALRGGAERVVAVEIDPGIIEFGRRMHPERPYDDKRVVIVNDDARSYFATCTEQFDVIAFGLLDSHTTTAMTNARLDHYVYTKESLAHARKLLKPGGTMVLSFEAQKPYIADRMGTALEQVFGHRPVIFRVPGSNYGWGGLLFVLGDSEADVKGRIAADPKLAELVATWQEKNPVTLTGATKLTTDDWPYIYLERPTVPVLYFVLAAVLLGLYLTGRQRIGVKSEESGLSRAGLHFFLLGAAFMLLEVQNVSKAAVVLGNTWMVNAVIISGVMVMILLANLVAARFPKLPLQPVYALLVLSCLGLYFVDLSSFAFLPYATKALVVGLLTSLPMFFSGIVFIRSFAVAANKGAALGSNLFGSLVGGLLQTVTFVTGIKALLLIVAMLYLAAVLSRPKAEAATPEPVAA